jgi:hypothetical protein
MKNRHIHLLLIIIVLSTTGCYNEYSNAGPREVLIGFMEKMARKDFDYAEKLATEKYKNIVKWMRTGYNGPRQTNDAPRTDWEKELKEMQIGEPVITGDSVTIIIVTKDTRLRVQMRKEKGAWKVAGEGKPV